MSRRFAFALILGLAATPAEANWTCAVDMVLEGHRGALYRGVGEDGRPIPGYAIRLARGEGPDRLEIVWLILGAGETMPGDQPYPQFRSRPEAEAFAGGPNYVSIHYIWTARVRRGAVWGYFYVDGRYAGRERLLSAEWTHARGRGESLTGGPTDPRLYAALSAGREWTVVALDAGGAEVYREHFRMPLPAEAEAAWRIARARIDAMAADYRRACQADDDPEI